MRPEVLLVVIMTIVSFAAGEELRCERIAVGACQNLVYDMTIASAPETALQYLSSSVPVPGGGVNSTAAGSVRTWLDAERLVSVLLQVQGGTTGGLGRLWTPSQSTVPTNQSTPKLACHTSNHQTDLQLLHLELMSRVVIWSKYSY
uniref:Uncharacterized protein n=1 Tax=Anopheles melas TaxID=34690 RepID=A0A182TPT0_9DIPT